LDAIARGEAAAHEVSTRTGDDERVLFVAADRTAATEYGARGVRINVVCPGPTRTPMLTGIFDQLAAGNTDFDRTKAESMYASHVPLGRIGEADELAQAIVWLLSPGASFVNGAVLSVDGGFTSAAL
jgi:NAD(P)-dependent dehydrogenase (short-subunit alcohol dehydrogenase family)